ncbi:hypothetical protein HDV00_009212 [Rhizophlyctis rosea]|nr:hypothetical protein HDV00_009212 [Rhizophlyctis rosea]
MLWTTHLPFYYGPIRALRIFPHPTPTRYAIAGTDARVGITYTQAPEKSFTFKCHRVESEAEKMKWAVNAVESWSGERGVGGVFATFGADGRW